MIKHLYRKQQTNNPPQKMRRHGVVIMSPECVPATTVQVKIVSLNKYIQFQYRFIFNHFLYFALEVPDVIDVNKTTTATPNAATTETTDVILRRTQSFENDEK